MSGGEQREGRRAALRRESRHAFRALEIPAFRRYFFAQCGSAIGTWMQTIGQSWLVYELTGSSTALGVVVMLQFTPTLLLGPMFGVWVERMSVRKVMLTIQVASTVLATLLGVLTVAGAVSLWFVYANAMVLGVVSAARMATGNVFLFSLVDRELLHNAVSLNLVQFNVARAVGPSLAGATIAVVGIGPCLLLNALSFVPLMFVVARLRPEEMHERDRVARAPGQFRDGIRYIVSQRELLGAVVMLALFGTLVWEFEVTVPPLAEQVFAGGAGVYGLLMSGVGLGAIVGAILAARLTEPRNRDHLVGAIACGIGLTLASLAPTLPVALVGMAIGGAGLTAWYGILTAHFQLTAAPEYQARCMAVWSTALNGVRPVGGPFVGGVGELAGARAGLLLGGVSLLVLIIPVWVLVSGNRFIATMRGTDGPSPQEPHDPAADAAVAGAYAEASES